MRLLRGVGRGRIMVVRVINQRGQMTTKSVAGYYCDTVARKALVGLLSGSTRTTDDLAGDSFFGLHMHNTMHIIVHNESRPASCQTAYRVVSRGFMPGAGLEPASLAAEDFKSPPANIG